MTEIQIACLELIIMGSSGIILALSGAIIAMLVKKQNQSCTEKTEGIVKKYGFPGDGKIYPVVEYYVNGSCYKTKKKFNGVITKRISGHKEHGFFCVHLSGRSNGIVRGTGILFDTIINSVKLHDEQTSLVYRIR